MNTSKKNQSSGSDRFWTISRGKYAKSDLSRIADGLRAARVKEYRISDFGRYLLSPQPIEIPKRLVGCEVYYRQRKSRKTRVKIWQILPKKLNPARRNKEAHSEVFMPMSDSLFPSVRNGDLESHLNKIYGLLKSYDPIYQGLANLDRSKISDVIGICEDVGGHRTWLHLTGSIEEKIDYVGNHIFQNISVIVDKACLADGLFELRGYAFESFDPGRSYRLLKFFQNKAARVCVLRPDGRLDYWLDDSRHITYLHLLAQSLNINRQLRESFNQCVSGRAKPLKLMFQSEMAIDYSKTQLPGLVQEAISTHPIGGQGKRKVVEALNRRQKAVLFSYLSRSDSRPEKLCTNLSVMHDLRALDPIKDSLPQLYSDLHKIASISEAGNFYLLDSIEDHQDA